MNLTRAYVTAIQSSLGLPPCPPLYLAPSSFILRLRKFLHTLLPLLTDCDIVLGLLVALRSPSTASTFSDVKRTPRVARLLRRFVNQRRYLNTVAPLYVWSPRLMFRPSGRFETRLLHDRYMWHFRHFRTGGDSKWYCTACDQHYARSYPVATHNGTAKHRRAARGFLA